MREHARRCRLRIGYQVETGAVLVSGGFATNYDLGVVSTAQLGDPLPGTETFNWVNTHWRGENAEHFALAWFLDRFPTGFTRAVSWDELATLRREFGPGAEGDSGVPFLTPQPPTGSPAMYSVGYEVTMPSTQTSYVTTEGVRWQTSLWLVPSGEFYPVAEFDSPWRAYRAGRAYDERFNFPVFGPGLPALGSEWAYRVGDDIGVRLPLFTDSGGNAGFTESKSGSTRLYLGDQLVGETPVGGRGYFGDLPAAPGKYRLTTEAVSPLRFAPTASVSAEWTFSSSHVDGNDPVALPLNTVRFLPALAEDGSAPAGRPFAVPLKVQDETGGYHRPRKLTVEVSYDDGTTWQRVRVTADQVAKLRHPEGATSVSLRASATDRDGNTVTQIVIRAYTLR